MSDYQHVDIKSVSGPTIVLEIREVHHDVTAIQDLTAGQEGEVSPERLYEAAVFASFLLRDYGYPFARNAFCQGLRQRSEWPEPTVQIVRVGFSKLQPIDTSTTHRVPMYRAEVTITVSTPTLLHEFKVGSYGAAAHPQSPWERSHFLG